MGGSFGGAIYQGTYEYDNEEEALNDAYRMAEEEYQSYEGYHGIMSWSDCKEDLIESYGEDISEEDVDLYYLETMESWISYKIKLVSGPDDVDDD